MLGRNWKSRILSLVLGLSLVAGTLPDGFTVYAQTETEKNAAASQQEDTAELLPETEDAEKTAASEDGSEELETGGAGEGDVTDETEASGVSENPNETEAVSGTEETDETAAFDASGTAEEEQEDDVPAVLDAEAADTERHKTLPEASASLQSILETDDDGNPMIYTTLYDDAKRVIDTNDPEYEQDAFYKNGGTVDLGAAVDVRFRLAEILSHDGENGVQENVTYYMDQLPGELIPEEQDDDGNQLLNPEEPIAFIQTLEEDPLNAWGGIYGTEGNWKLKMFFEGVANRMDISGSFQYGAVVSDSLIPGEVCTVTWVPGGTLRFTVTPEAPEPGDGDYTLQLSGGSGGPTIYHWFTMLKRTTVNEDENILPYREMTIDTEDAMGVWVNEEEQGIVSGYGEGNGPGLSANVVYTKKNADNGFEGEWITAGEKNVIQNADGVTVIRLSGAKSPLQIDVEFRKVDAVADTVNTHYGKNAYITNKVHVSISDGNGNPAPDILSLQLYVPTIAYDDYQVTGSRAYHGTVTATGGESNSRLEPLQAEGDVNAYYYDLSTPIVNGGPQNPVYSYGFFPDSIYTVLNSNTTGYKGNYYWVEYDPAVVNTLGANYYMSNRSFMNEGKLADENGQNATFLKGTGLVGMVGTTDWVYMGEISVSQIQGDPHLVANSSCFSYDSAADVKLQYQLKQVFAHANGSDNMFVYRSASRHSCGEYSYILVDPGTCKTAADNQNYGWYEYIEGNGSARPASWKLHIFNAPYTSFSSTSYQYLGTMTTDDQNVLGERLITDQLKTGIGSCDAEASQTGRGSFHFFNAYPRYRSSQMNARWVSDDTIFWEFTFSARNWPEWYAGSFYAKTENTMELRPYGTFSVDGQKLSADELYVRVPDKSQPNQDAWEKVYTPSVSGGRRFYGANSDKMEETTTLVSNSSDQTMQMIYNQSSGWKQYRDDNNCITVGFFTKVNGGSEEYSCSAEIVTRNGDVSQFVGNNGGDLPSDSAGATVQFPFKVRATGKTAAPQLAKQGMLADSGSDATKLAMNWTIRFDDAFPCDYAGSGDGPLMGGGGNVRHYGYYGGYNGILRVGDNMADSVASNSAGVLVEGIRVGEYVHITKPFTTGFSIIETGNGGGGGPVPFADPQSESGWYGSSGWEKYENGQWKQMGKDCLWDPEHPGIYRMIMTTSGTNSDNNPLAVYTYYAGNMADSVRSTLGSQIAALGMNPSDDSFDNAFVVEYRGLNHVSRGSGKISNLDYTTEFDSAGFQEAADALFTEKWEKLYYDVDISNEASCGMWKKTGQKPVTERLSKRISALLAIEKQVETEEGEGNGYTDLYTLKVTNGFSETDEILLEDDITGLSNVEMAIPMEPLENGVFTSNRQADAIRELCSFLHVENLEIEMAQPGKDTEKIYEQGRFSSAWYPSSVEESQGTEEQPGELFHICLKKTTGTIPAGAEFRVTYKLRLDMDGDDDTPGFRDSKWYMGKGIKISNMAQASRPYNTLEDDAGDAQVQKAVQKKYLTVDSGAVEGTYLTGQVLTKKYTSFGTDGGHSEWIYSAYTGTAGKTTVDMALYDRLQYAISEMRFTDASTGKQVKLSEISDPAVKEQLQTVMEHLVEKHAVYSHLKIYYGNVKPSDRDNLQDQDLLWDLGDTFSFSGGTAVTGGRASLTGIPDLTFGETPQRTEKELEINGIHLKLTTVPATLGTDTEGTGLAHEHAGFDVEATGLARNKYLTAVYDIDVDWAAVQADAGKIFGNYSLTGLFKNTLDNNMGGQADASSNVVALEEGSLTKSRTSSNSQDGSAQWQISARTGGLSGNILEIQDQLTVQEQDGLEERVRAAVEAAAWIDPSTVRIWRNNRLIYWDGEYRNGWTDVNLTVEASSRELHIVVKNTEDNPVLERNQTYTVVYTSRLDKDVFLQNGGRKGDVYTLLNTAGMDCGGARLDASSTGTFRPNVPIEVKKTMDGADENRAEWTASVKTGEAARKDLKLQDAVTSADTAVQGALSIEDMTIVVNDGKGNEESYTPDTLPEGAVLTKQDGSAFMLGETGTEDFVLTFAELPAGYTVTVHYVTRLDRETYLANGGVDDSTVPLKNAFHAGSADGYEGGAERTGSVFIHNPFSKKGQAVSGVLSPSGNPILEWTLRVNLTEEFSEEELQQLEEVTLTDHLSPVLAYVDGSIQVKNQAGAVPFEASTAGNDLKITLKTPAQTPNVTVTFRTECLYSLDSLMNRAIMDISGKKKETTSPDIGKIHANGQKGTIQSVMKVPSFTPVAWKYVDHVLCQEKGAYTFTLTAVDENGAPLTGEEAYTETRSNRADGSIHFSRIRYAGAGTWYYQIREQGEQTLDDRVFTIRVEAVNTSDGYIVSSSILLPENYEKVLFDNTTEAKTTDYTVTKVWDDQEDTVGIRPENIVVHLLQNGEPYDNLSVTLNAENNWTYTWTGLPVVGGAYSVREETVPGYIGTVENQETGAVVTNRIDANSLTIRKTVTGDRGEKDRAFTFTVSLKDADGNALTGEYPYSGSQTGTISDGGTLLLKDGERVTITGLPENAVYEVTEKEANADGYTTTVTGGQGSLDGQTPGAAVFVNDRPAQPEEPEKPDNPETPEQPDNPHTPDQPETPDQPAQPGQPDSGGDTDTPQAATPGTGDNAHPAVWMALGAAALVVILVICAWRKRKTK